MAKPYVHSVGKGESLFQIADGYRVDWKTVWEAPENKELREIRKSPDFLALGDVLQIPLAEQEGEECATEEHHVFEMEIPKVYLRLQILDENLETPISDTDYELAIPGEREPRAGKTGSKGEIEEEIAPSTREASLTVLSTPILHWELSVGDLDPLLEKVPDDPDHGCVRGIQQRLGNLGFRVGTVTGKMNDLTRDAIRTFRKKHDLSDGDRCDEEFQRKLQVIHDRIT